LNEKRKNHGEKKGEIKRIKGGKPVDVRKVGRASVVGGGYLV